MFTLQHSKDVLYPIIDNTSLQDVISVKRNGTLKSIKITVDIKHGYSGDLKIVLKSPSGKEVILHNRHGGPSPFAKKTYEGNMFSNINGESIKGKWCLQVTDMSPRDPGMFKNWKLEMEAEHTEKSVGKVLVDIPDNKSEGLVSLCEFKEDGVLEALKCSVNIQHSYVGDLSATLTAPSGKKAVLQNRQGGAQKNLKHTYKDEVTAAFKGENIKGIWKLQVNDHAARDSGVLHGWGLSMKIGSGNTDDLTKIEGIGPKIAELFKAAGLKTFADVANASQNTMKKILSDAGPRFQTHDPGTWARQSSMAALGDWKNLKKWQDELDGGK